MGDLAAHLPRAVARDPIVSPLDQIDDAGDIGDPGEADLEAFGGPRARHQGDSRSVGNIVTSIIRTFLALCAAFFPYGAYRTHRHPRLVPGSHVPPAVAGPEGW